MLHGGDEKYCGGEKKLVWALFFGPQKEKLNFIEKNL